MLCGGAAPQFGMGYKKNPVFCDVDREFKHGVSPGTQPSETIKSYHSRSTPQSDPTRVLVSQAQDMPFNVV